MKKLAFLLLAALPALVNAQTDDFNDGNDNGWRQYDPIKAAVGTNIATFTLTNGAYRIQTYRTPNAAFGPARAGSLREDVTYTDFYLTVDIVNWNTNLNQAFGLLARVKEVGLGSTDGYAMTWDSGGRDLDISVFTNEVPVNVRGQAAGNANLVPGRSYRLVFMGQGAILTGEVYDLSNLDTPLTSISVEDLNNSWTSGICGLIIYDNAPAATQAGTDATFDNYFALSFRPPRLKLEVLTFDDLVISWPAEPTNYVLQATSTLGVNWVDITEPIEEGGGRRSYLDNSFGQERRFYRLRP